MLKNNKIGFGIFLGVFAPVIGILLLYFLKFYPTFSLRNFFAALKDQPQFITAVASLSLFVNVALLTFYLNKRKDKTAIGIFIITLFYGIAALLLKWLL